MTGSTSRTKADRVSLSALHAWTGERHSTFEICLTLAECHAINRVREAVAASLLADIEADPECERLPRSHKPLEAMDVICDQLGLEDMPNRQRAGAAGARAPWTAESIRRFVGFPIDLRSIAP
jgi:hypothetical protein